MTDIIGRDVEKSLPEQQRFAKDLEQRYRCVFRDRDKFDPIDYDVLRNNKIVAYVELKNRSFKYDTYNTLFINESKIEALRKNLMLTGIKTLLFIRLLDRDLYYEVNLEDKFRVEYGGRTKNYRVPKDIDYVVHIPIEKFKISEDNK